MVSKCLLSTLLVLFSITFVRAYKAGGGWSFSCPAIPADDDSFPEDETELRDMLASLGKLTLVARDGLIREQITSCVTLTFDSPDTYYLTTYRYETPNEHSGDVSRITNRASQWSVYLNNVNDYIFNNAHMGSSPWLQFTEMDDDFVYARSCQHIGFFSGWHESRYVFARESVDTSALDMDCLINAMNTKYDTTMSFTETGICD